MRVLKNDIPQIYTLVDEQGGGILIPWAKYALKTGDVSDLRDLFDTMVRYFMYNDGRGKFVPITELVAIRNKQRNAIFNALRRKKRKGKIGPNILEEFDQSHSRGDLRKALKILDGFGRGNRDVKYRMMVWDIGERGHMGETLLHLCLLHNTVEHNFIAKELVVSFPKLVNDIFISEEYYGLSPLHEAIVNEDIQMLYFLLKQNADVHQRCYGAFFSCEDQRESRSDSFEHEWVDVQQNTKYTGRMYWGEYPLNFAACTDQPDCVRLLCAFKADPNMKDTNGNTVLHMCVIHELQDMLQLLHSLGAKMNICNNVGLTPLGLAAKLAKKNMFDAILNLEKHILWSCRGTNCIAYPLNGIDTVDEITGHLNQKSALSLVVYGEQSQHLDFFDSFMDELVQQKWNTFGKRKLLHSIIGYVVYLISFSLAFVTRSPNPPTEILPTNLTSIDINRHLYNDDRCFLWSYADPPGKFFQKIRLVCELIAVASSFFQFSNELRQISHSGISRWWKTITFFLIFKSCERDSGLEFENVFVNPGESILRMFIMSVGEFTAVYKNLHTCQNKIGILGKILFVIYELLVTVMLLNLLIAMMTRTYERIAETQKEWKRQWAQVILMLEQTVPPQERLQHMLQYSRPLTTDKTKRALVVRQHKEAKISPITSTRKLIPAKKKLKRLLVTLSSFNGARRKSLFSSSEIPSST